MGSAALSAQFSLGEEVANVLNGPQSPLPFNGYHSIFQHTTGLVVGVLGYRSGGPGSIPGTTRKKVVGLERGPLSLMSTTEELLDRKVAAPV
jgi:hypothetical protein